MKNRKQHDLEELLKNNLSDKTAVVPDLVWDNIEEKLFPKKKRRGFFWLFFSGSLLISGMTAAYFFSGEKESNRNIATSEYSDVAIFRKGTKPSAKLPKYQGKITHKKQGTASPDHAGAALKDVNTKLQTKGKSNIEQEENKLNQEFSNTGKGFNHGNQNGAKKISIGQEHNKSKKNTGRTKPNNEIAADESKGEISTPEPINHKVRPVQKDSIEANRLPFMEASFQIERIEDGLARSLHPKVNTSPLKKFAIGIYGGTSIYEMAIFKEYFTSGQLSKRTFESSGFELGTGLHYKLGNRFGIYSTVAFNRKSTSFRYNLAITETDYFQYILNGELLPIENIVDNGTNNCFLAENVTSRYHVDSWLISLGTTYELVKWKKIAIGMDLRLSANLNSSMDLEKLTVIKVPEYGKEKFNYLKLGGGLTIDYKFSNRFSAGIAPMYHFQFMTGKQSFYAGKLKELVIPVVFKFYF